MKIVTGGKDLWQLIESLTLSGDTKQVSRKLSFSIAKNTQDPNFPVVTINEGDEVLLLDDNEQLIYGGIIFDIDKTASSNLIQYLAYDLMFYVNNSELTKDFAGTPEAIAAEVCTQLGITPGSLAATGITISNPCVKKTGYQIIQSSYTAAARQNGLKYMQMITDINKLSVIEMGSDSGVRLTADANLSEASYKSSLQSLVNKVLITDKTGKILNTIEDIESQQNYGTVQKILQQQDGKDATSEARNMMKGSTHSASVSGFPDDLRARAGYSVLVEEPDTGLVGKFFIASDTHSYSNGSATMDLTLEFDSIMDEVEPGTQEEKN